MHCNDAEDFPFGAYGRTVVCGVHDAPILDSGEFCAGATLTTTHVVAGVGRRIRDIPFKPL
jgi:hypothetical protein